MLNALSNQQVLVVLLAALAAATLAVTLHTAASAPHGSRGAKALAGYHAPAAVAAQPDINTALGLAQPASAKWLRLGLTGGACAALVVAGLPVVPALGGAALVFLLVDEFLKGKTRQARLAIEQELPTFVARLGGMLIVTNSPRKACEDVTKTLQPDRPLRIWLDRLLSDWQAGGDSVLATAHLQANQITPLLGLVVYQLRRLAESGNAGAVSAFGTTAEELSAILEARAVAASKAAGARGAVLTMLGIMAVIMALLLSSPTMRAGYNDPTAQLVTAGSLAVMGFGYLTLNNMIAEALEV